MDYLNVLTDIAFVFLIQCVIVFLVIIVPSLVTVFREAGLSENSQYYLEQVSSADIREMLNNNFALSLLKRTAGLVGMIFAPVLYEQGKKVNGTEREKFTTVFFRGAKLNFKQFFMGAVIGLIYAGVAVVGMYLFGSQKGSFTLLHNPGALITDVIFICLLCFAREMMVRHYVAVKTAEFPSAALGVISCIFFIAVESVSLGFESLDKILALCLISVLLTIWTVKEKNISKNVGFRAVVESLLFVALGEKYTGNVFASMLLVLIIFCELLFIIRRKVKDNEVLQEVPR